MTADAVFAQFLDLIEGCALWAAQRECVNGGEM